MVRLLQGIVSSDVNINQRPIMYRFTEKDGSYIEYLPLPESISVLDSPENHNMRSELNV